MNLFLHEIEDFQIARGDTLRHPALRNPDGTIRKFDVVIANPPFSLANWGRETWAADPRAFCGVPPADKGDWAWIQHMICSMEAGAGRVGVVMPHGVLFRSQEADIRTCVVQSDKLEAVIVLAGNLFYSTTIPACLLILRSDKPETSRGKTLFIDGSTLFHKGRNQNELRPEHAEILLDAFANRDSEHVPVREVPLEEILANDCDLNPGRYLQRAFEQVSSVGDSLAGYAEARARRMDTDERLQELLSALEVS